VSTGSGNPGRRDAEHYNYFRDYDPAIGRYIKSDPIGLKGGINTFGYVDGDPLKKSDVLGLATFSCTKPLHGLGPIWGPRLYSPGPANPLYHQFLCVRDAQGNVSCGGQDRSGGAFGKGSPGKPSDDKWPSPGEGTCQLQDSRTCVDNCTIRRITDKKRPWYGIPNGTDCQEWADEVVKDCKAECKGQK
jgi:RHS repeat-associated protein